MPEASTVFTTMAKPKGLKPCPSKQDLHQAGKHQGKPREGKDCQCQRQAQCSPPWLSPKGSSHAQASKTCTKLASTKASQEKASKEASRVFTTMPRQGAQAVHQEPKPATRCPAPEQTKERLESQSQSLVMVMLWHSESYCS